MLFTTNVINIVLNWISINKYNHENQKDQPTGSTQTNHLNKSIPTR